jgi:hypothetical protein
VSVIIIIIIIIIIIVILEEETGTMKNHSSHIRGREVFTLK